MVVNFKTCGISWGARKLARTPTLNKKKNPFIFYYSWPISWPFIFKFGVAWWCDHINYEVINYQCWSTLVEYIYVEATGPISHWGQASSPEERPVPHFQRLKLLCYVSTRRGLPKWTFISILALQCFYYY